MLVLEVCELLLSYAAAQFLDVQQDLAGGVPDILIWMLNGRDYSFEDVLDAERASGSRSDAKGVDELVEESQLRQKSLVGAQARLGLDLLSWSFDSAFLGELLGGKFLRVCSVVRLDPLQNERGSQGLANLWVEAEV